MNYIKALMVGALCSLFVSCQEDVYVATVVVEDPIITDFEPTTGPVGTQITIYGENLEKIQSVTVGGGDTPIIYRISDTQLVVEVGTDTRSGAVAVTDNYGTEVTSSGSFTVSYGTPAVTSWSLPTTTNEPIETEAPDGNYGEAGQMIVFEGSDLHFVDEVQFCYQEEVDVVDENGDVLVDENGDPTGETEWVDAVAVGTFITQREDEIVVEIPLINVSSDTEIHLTYYDGSDDAYVDIATIEDMGLFHIIVLVPLITSDFPATLVKYEKVTLEGYNLNLINSLYVEDEDGNVVKLSMTAQTSDYIIVDIATNFFSSDYNTDYIDGDVTPIWGFTGDVIMVYNTDKDEIIASDVELWSNPVEPRYSTYQEVYMSGRDNSSYGNSDDHKAFFDFDSGVVYDSCGIVDAYPELDLMFYDSGANQAKLNGAHNASGTYKNYKCNDVALNVAISNWAPEATVKFRVLDPSDEDHAAVIAGYQDGSFVYLSSSWDDETSAYVANDSRIAAISTPSTSSPLLYESVASYSASSIDLDTYRYVLIHRSAPDDRYGILEVKTFTLNPDNSYGQSMTFDMIWSLQ